MKCTVGSFVVLVAVWSDARWNTCSGESIRRRATATTKKTTSKSPTQKDQDVTAAGFVVTGERREQVLQQQQQAKEKEQQKQLKREARLDIPQRGHGGTSSRLLSPSLFGPSVIPLGGVGRYEYAGYVADRSGNFTMEISIENGPQMWSAQLSYRPPDPLAFIVRLDEVGRATITEVQFADGSNPGTTNWNTWDTKSNTFELRAGFYSLFNQTDNTQNQSITPSRTATLVTTLAGPSQMFAGTSAQYTFSFPFSTSERVFSIFQGKGGPVLTGTMVSARSPLTFTVNLDLKGSVSWAHPAFADDYPPAEIWYSNGSDATALSPLTIGAQFFEYATRGFGFQFMTITIPTRRTNFTRHP